MSARTLAWLELTLCLIPATVVWLCFAPSAAGMGAHGVLRALNAAESVSANDEDGVELYQMQRRQAQGVFDEHVAAQRRRVLTELVPAVIGEWRAAGSHRAVAPGPAPSCRPRRP